MKKISDALREIINSNQFLTYGMQNKLINLTQLAKHLKSTVEVRTKKDLKSSTALLMALSRMQNEYGKKVKKLVKFKVKNVTAYSNLSIYTFSRNAQLLSQLGKLYAAIEHRHCYITLGQGTDEVTLIVNDAGVEELKKHLKDKPKHHSGKISALSVKFDEEYYNDAGILYYLIQQVTLQGINIKEITSTFTEIVFYVDEKDMKLLFDTIYTQFKD